MHFCSICAMLHLYNCLLITVNALERLLMRRASATSCGSVPSIMNRRNGFAQAGPSSSSVAAPSGVLGPVPSDGLAAASPAASAAAAVFLMDLGRIPPSKAPGVIGPWVHPIFASLSASVLLALVM